jgi:hypothetical protein
MGRVAKYKKIKAFDPYSKQNRGNVDLESVGVWGLGADGRKPKKRSRRSEMLRASRGKQKKTNERDVFDLPPEADDFDMKDLVGSVKRQKIQQEPKENGPRKKSNNERVTVALPTNLERGVPVMDKEDREMIKFLKVDKQVQRAEKKQVEDNATRREGESKRAYRRRLKAEVQQSIRKDKVVAVNPEKKERKREFLKNKKLKKKGGAAAQSFSSRTVDVSSDGGNDSDDGFITGEMAKQMVEDQVPFGEQADRPPIFNQLPRGAQSKARKENTKATKKGMSSAQIEAEHNAMEIMRRKVQAQYALIKAKRKREGDFHL